MRDEQRIDRILDKLRQVWKENPDQRFYQMLINNGILNDDISFWNYEDDKLEEWLDKIN